MTDRIDLPRLTGEQLLPLLVADTRRHRQRDRGHTILLVPLPPCPVCQNAVTEQRFTLGLGDFDERVLTVQPCGHRMTYNLRVAEQLADRAQQLAVQEEERPVAAEATEATELASLRREVAAARKFAAEMRDFCSPHGVAADYADRLLESMDRAKAGPA